MSLNTKRKWLGGRWAGRSKAMTGLAFAEAISELESHGKDITEARLREILNRVSVDQIDGAPSSTLLYSGRANLNQRDTIPKNTSAEIAAQGAGQVATIDNTHATRFIIGDAFKTALTHIFGDTVVPSSEQVSFLFDSRAQNPSSPGVWDLVSHRFAAGIGGEVVTFSGFADTNRIFIATEVPALLTNRRVTKINGIDIAVYRRIQSHFLREGRSAQDAAIEASKSINYKSVKLWGGAEIVNPK